ncbi:hypothetical protein AltI4_33520 [Alteromonas sp. I4]|nr:hypothetical protein AltI4_33520 [Alteromonas sp. I4]
MLLIALTPAFSFKNTGFFLSLLLLVYILLILNNEKRVKLSVSLTISSVLVIAFTGVGFLLYDYILPYLPSGSPEVRLETYSFRINTFLENVFFGDYAGSNMLLRIGYLFWGFDIPSHSDVLDILAFFGLFGAFVFYYPVFLSIFRAAYTNSHDLTYLFIIAGFVFLMAFNPIINQPKLIVVYYYILATAYEKFRFKIKL